MPFTKYRSILGPEDLNNLQAAFDRLCKLRRVLDSDWEQREALAAEVVRAYQQGWTTDPQSFPPPAPHPSREQR